MAIIVIITKASVSSLESSCFSTYSGAPQGHHVIFPAKGPPPAPSPIYIYIYHCYISYINISLLHPRWDEQCRDTMMTVPPQLTSSLPSFSYPASFRHPPPASSFFFIVTQSSEVPQWKSMHLHFSSKPNKSIKAWCAQQSIADLPCYQIWLTELQLMEALAAAAVVGSEIDSVVPGLWWQLAGGWPKQQGQNSRSLKLKFI